MHAPTPSLDWFRSPLGAQLERQESAVLLPALEEAVGLHALQVGTWGARGEWLSASRAQRRTLLAAPGAFPGAFDGPQVVAELDQWPIQSDMVDTVLLPHTLDFAEDPHAVVREAVRVLVGEGQLLVMGFAPLGTWHRLSALRREPPPTQQARPIGEQRLHDWLHVLGCETVSVRHCLGGVPSTRLAGGRLESLLERAGPRWWPWGCGAYLLRARKHVPSITAIRLRWQRRKPSFAAGTEPLSRGGSACGSELAREESRPRSLLQILHPCGSELARDSSARTCIP